MKRLAIPDGLFRVVRGTSGSRRIVVLLFQIRDGGKPVSRKGVSVRVGRDGGKGISDGRCCGSLGGEGVLKGGRDRQIQRGEGPRDREGSSCGG